MLRSWWCLCLLCLGIPLGERLLWGQTPVVPLREVEQTVQQTVEVIQCNAASAIHAAVRQALREGLDDVTTIMQKIQHGPLDGRPVQGVRHWDLVTRWNKGSTFHRAAEQFATEVRVASHGCLTIRVYAYEEEFKGGKPVKDFGEIYDMVARREAPMGHSTTYYRAGAEGGCNGCELLTTVPFGMTVKDHTAWLLHGGGIALWEQVYNPPVTFLPLGTTGMQMGGWFKTPIRTMDDFRGLRMRIPGLGADVLAKAGVVPRRHLLETELLTACQQGEIDAAEWVGPREDKSLKLFECFKVYHSPGWHEPATTLGLFIHKQEWQALPAHLQTVVRAVAGVTHHDLHAKLEAANAQALQELEGLNGLEITPFPFDVMQRLHALTAEVLKERSQNPKFKRMYEAYSAFSHTMTPWSLITSAYESQRTYQERKAKAKDAIVRALQFSRALQVQVQEEASLTVTFLDTFDSGSDLVKAPLRALIQGVAEVLRKYPPAFIVIEGHTDTSGDTLANIDLAERRARAIRTLLVAHHLPTPRIAVIPYGSSKCLAQGDDVPWKVRTKACAETQSSPEAREKQRRVAMTIVLQ